MATARLPSWRDIDWRDRASVPSLGQTLITLLVALVFFPVLSLTVWESRQAISTIERDVQSNLNAIARDLSIELYLWHQPYRKAMQTLAESAAAGDDDLDAKLEAIAATLPSFLKLYVTDAEGRVVAAYPATNERGQSAISSNISDRPIFQTTRTRLQHQITGVRDDRANFDPHVTMSEPIVRDAQFAGIAYGSLNTDDIVQLLNTPINLSDRYTFSQIGVTLSDRQQRAIAIGSSPPLASSNWASTTKSIAFSNPTVPCAGFAIAPFPSGTRAVTSLAWSDWPKTLPNASTTKSP